MDFLDDIYIENQNVRLVPLSMDHFDDLLVYSLNEPKLWQHALISAYGEDNLRKYIKEALSDRNAQKSYPFIVFDKETSKYCGCTRFYNINIKHKTLNIGYTWYGKSYQGTGINKNCKLILLQFAFEQLMIERIEFRADVKNIRSINAMKSIGCKEEGILRSNKYKLDGSRRDSIVLSILKSEWEDNKKLLLQKLEVKIEAPKPSEHIL